MPDLHEPEGVIAVAQEGLVVEARTLARACFENLFLIYLKG
jgi:hypothetical protein